jgi:homospermidine synthase
MTEEVITPAEMAWGTHERNIPSGMLFHDETKESCNLVCLINKEMNTWVNILHFLSFLKIIHRFGHGYQVVT